MKKIEILFETLFDPQLIEEILDLWDNKFSDVPIELTNLKSLFLLRFDNNPISSSNSTQKKCRALLPGVEFSF
jgi:hypothetical protein